MNQDNKVYFGEEAIAGLMEGMKIVHDAVARTMGAAGKNVVYRQYGWPKATNDGVSIANEISPADPLQRMGADWIKQPAQRTVDEVGDGTSTTIVLSYSMAENGLQKILAGVNPMRLRREMEASSKRIIEKLKEMAHEVTSDEELFNIANISVEDAEIATLVRDAAKKAGLDGNVIVEESNGIAIEKEEIDGFRFENGYISPYMITNPQTMEAVLENVPVLITDKKLQMNADMFGLMEEVVRRCEKRLPDGKVPLVIIAEDVTGELLQTFIANRITPKGAIHVVAVKKPYYPETLEDLATLTGGEVLSELKGIKELKAEHYGHLGFAQRVVVTKDNCLIAGGYGDKTKIEERISSIKTALEEADGYEERKLKDRLAHINGSVVILKVGAPTRGEMKYLKDKIDDAVHAVRAAMEEGIVIGAGRALYDISLEPYMDDGDEVVKKACGEPIRRILENAGEDPKKFLGGKKLLGMFEFEGQLGEGEVFNVYTGQISSNPLAEGIIDPVKVERSALANSVSFAGLFLTTHATIIDLPAENDKDNQGE